MSDLVEDNPWDQLKGESLQEFRRFSVYLGLNKRTVSAAYKVWKSQEESEDSMRAWIDNSRKWFWDRRGKEFDCHILSTYGKAAAMNFVQAMAMASQRAIEAMNKLEPESWKEVLETLDAISQNLPPALLEKILASGTGLSEPHQPQLLADQPEPSNGKVSQ